jgi:hypothetical protein
MMNLVDQRAEDATMIKNPRARRTLSLVLLVLGGVLLFLAPADIWIGVVLIALGIALEVAGAVMRRR